MEPRFQYAKTKDGVSIAFATVELLPEAIVMYCEIGMPRHGEIPRALLREA